MPSRRPPEASASGLIVTTPRQCRSIVKSPPFVLCALNGYTGIVSRERSQEEYSADQCVQRCTPQCLFSSSSNRAIPSYGEIGRSAPRIH